MPTSKRRPAGDVAADALAMLAVARQELGDPEAAGAALDRLAQGFPESRSLAPTRLRLGEAALDAGQNDRAAALLAPAAESLTDPSLKARALSGLGWSRLGSDDPAGAAEAFAQLLTVAPQDPLAPESALARGWSLEKAGNTDGALAAYDEALEHYGESARAPAIRLARARLLDRLGASALQDGQAEQAASRFQQAAEAYQTYLKEPETSPANTDTVDRVLSELGWALLGAGNRPEADAAFQRILDEYGNSPQAADARLILAESAHRTGDAEAVEALLTPIVAEGSPADAARQEKALFQLGLARFDRRDWAGAREAFGRISSEFPESPMASRAGFWQAEAAFQAEDAAAAEAGFAALLKSAESQPADPEVAAWLPTARLRHAESLNDLGRWADALGEAEALKAAEPEFPALHELEYARGRALQGLARFDEAREAYQSAIDANRADDFAARARFMRGETYFHQQNLQRGAEGVPPGRLRLRRRRAGGLRAVRGGQGRREARPAGTTPPTSTARSRPTTPTTRWPRRPPSGSPPSPPDPHRRRGRDREPRRPADRGAVVAWSPAQRSREGVPDLRTRSAGDERTSIGYHPDPPARPILGSAGECRRSQGPRTNLYGCSP